MVEVGINKWILRRGLNRFLQVCARNFPGATTVRPFLHRLRQVSVGRDVFIGDDVFLENEFPEYITIGDRVQISIRSVLIAHTRGPGRVIVEQDAFIGPNCVLVCGAGKTLRIGQGAVVGAGSVITKSVPPHLFVAPQPAVAMARVAVPLPTAKTMEEFWAGLSPLKPQPKPKNGTSSGS